MRAPHNERGDLMTGSSEPAKRPLGITRRKASERGLGLLLAILGLLIVVGASTALADETEAPSQEASSFVPGWTSEEAQEEAVQESDPEILAPPSTDPEAAEALPHDNLGRAEAVDLLTAVFGEVLDEAAGIFDELEVDQFRSDYAAVVEGSEPGSSSSPEAEQPALLTSLLPLRAENSEGIMAPIDLDLLPIEGELRPQNPLVEVEIPSEIDQGISLPEAGVTIDLADAPVQRSASNLEGTAAFYPNVGPDSDLTVLPTPTGIETSTILRTPEAPITQTYDLTIPPGAHLDATKEGGASVTKDGDTLLAIRTPTALDAEGDSVPVTLEVQGNSIVIHTAPGEGDAYPILVDPIYETYFWDQYPAGESPEWIPGSSPCFVAQWNMWASRGLAMYSCSYVAITPGSQATWNYYVPRFFTDMSDPLVHERPTSYIKRMTMANLSYFFSEGNPVKASPHITAGLWSEAYGKWVSVTTQNGIEGPVANKSVEFNNLSEVTDVKNGGISLASFESSTGFQRNVTVGQATVEISDKDYPKISEKGNPAAWVNNSPTSPITFKATDKGLGMHSMVVGEKKADGGTQYITTRNKNCDGSARVPCSRSWSSSAGPALSYDPSLMPQGEDWVTVDAIDPLNHNSAVDPEVPNRTEVKIKVDHSAPSLSLSGTLTEQAKVGTTASQYSLNYSASDGDHAAAAAQTPIGVAGTGVGKMQRPMGVAVDNAGNAYVVDRECKCVQKYNAAGVFISQFGSAGVGPGQFSDPRGIAWSSGSGRVLVTDVANHSVQVFTNTGGFVRQITASGLMEPYAIAAIPKQEKFWVSDIGGAHKVWRFAEWGESLGTARGTKADPSAETDFASPVGMAINAFSLVLADNGLNRISVFDLSGKFVNQFGTEGTGNGQLKGPVGVAIAPSGNLIVGDAGNNRIQVFQPNGTYLRKFGETGAGIAQFSEPRGMALDSSGAVLVADAANHRVTRWTHADLNAQSGVTKVEVKVDNQASSVFYDKSCAERDCAASGELLFNSSFYSTGQHKVVVTASDGVKLTTSKELIVNTVKDTTSPQLAATNQFYTAPEGWLEQSSYGINAVASDAGGYGVTSLTLRIDGKVVKTATQACPNGGCSLNLAKGISLDMASYKGGSHPAELIATDGAGLVSKKEWTINISPKGSIGPGETEDTIEAVEKTNGDAIIQPAPGTQTPAEEEQPPILNRDGEEISSENTPVESTMTTDPSDGFQLLTAKGLVSITPVGIGGTLTQPTPGGEAGISGNTGPGVDTAFRPIYDGGLQFQQIRTTAAPEEYTWKVNMFDNQMLEQVDARTAEVYEVDEQEAKHLAFNIRAEFAHDAIGTAVPTSLTVSGTSQVTLKVQYRAGNPVAGGAPFVYPITAGTGWEGGFVTEIVDIPDEAPPPGTPAYRIALETQTYSSLTVGAPEFVPAPEAEATASGVGEQRRKFLHVMCGHNYEWVEGKEGIEALLRQEGRCGNVFEPDDNGESVLWRAGMRGAFLYVPGERVRHKDARGCHEDTPGHSSILEFAVDDAYECHYGPSTSDGNGGAKAGSGHYLRAQAHWVLSKRSCPFLPNGQCVGTWVGEDKAMELHLWPSGNMSISVSQGWPNN